jgi:hypothetical protein
MSQSITIHVIKHKNQRYETVGDWEFINESNLIIKVSDLGVAKFNCLVAIHELVEALLCKFAFPEVTGKEVDKFDIEYEKNRKENNNSEPGDSPEAPYFEQHKLATVIEMAIASALKVSWEEYEKRINEL